MSKQKAVSKDKGKQKKAVKKEQKPQDRVFLFSRKELQQKLYNFMKRHIGARKSVTKKQIFVVLFGEVEQYTNLEVFYLWQYAKRIMNWMRRTTKMFIVSKRNDKFIPAQWRYYVVKTQKDAKPYIELMKNLKKKADYMASRCDTAVEEEWWKDL